LPAATARFFGVSSSTTDTMTSDLRRGIRSSGLLLAGVGSWIGARSSVVHPPDPTIPRYDFSVKLDPDGHRLEAKGTVTLGPAPTTRFGSPVAARRSDERSHRDGPRAQREPRAGLTVAARPAQRDSRLGEHRVVGRAPSGISRGSPHRPRVQLRGGSDGGLPLLSRARGLVRGWGQHRLVPATVRLHQWHLLGDRNDSVSSTARLHGRREWYPKRIQTCRRRFAPGRPVHRRAAGVLCFRRGQIHRGPPRRSRLGSRSIPSGPGATRTST